MEPGACRRQVHLENTLAPILLTVVVACPAVPQWQGCTRRAPLLLQPLSSLAIHTSRITLWSHTDCWYQHKSFMQHLRQAGGCLAPHHRVCAHELQQLSEKTIHTHTGTQHRGTQHRVVSTETTQKHTHQNTPWMPLYTMGRLESAPTSTEQYTRTSLRHSAWRLSPQHTPLVHLV